MSDFSSSLSSESLEALSSPYAARAHSEKELQQWARLLRWLEAGGDEQLRFSMSYFYSNEQGGVTNASCGTHACMAGFLAFGAERISGSRDEFNYARKLLGLSEDNAWQLFMQWPDDKTNDASYAAERCRRYLNTGIVIR